MLHHENANERVFNAKAELSFNASILKKLHMLLSEDTALMVLCARLYYSDGMYGSCSSGILSDPTSCDIKCV